MFKKMFLAVCLVFLCSTVAMALPVEFTATGTSFSFNGTGNGDYDVTSKSDTFILDDGDFYETDLLTVTFNETASYTGQVEAAIQISQPANMAGSQTQTGTGDVWYVMNNDSIYVLSGSYDATQGIITWDDNDLTWNHTFTEGVYDYAGWLTLDLYDMTNVFCDFIPGDSFDLAGIFTYKQDFKTSTNPVPEPATMFLLGTGLIGMGAVSRKKFIKK